MCTNKIMIPYLNKEAIVCFDWVINLASDPEGLRWIGEFAEHVN